MLNIDEIQNGIVIDHIKAGTAVGLMDLLGIKSNRTANVALIQNARSHKTASRSCRSSRNKFERTKGSVLCGTLPFSFACYTKSSRMGVKRSSRIPASTQVQPCSTPFSLRMVSPLRTVRVTPSTVNSNAPETT